MTVLSDIKLIFYRSLLYLIPIKKLKAKIYYNIAYLYVNNYEIHNKAIYCYQKAILNNNKKVKYYIKLLSLYIKINKHLTSNELIELKLNLDNKETIKKINLLFNKNHSWNFAINFYKELLSFDESNENKYQLANYYNKYYDFENSEKILIELLSDNYSLNNELALVYEKQGKWYKAEIEYKNHIEMNKNIESSVYYRLGYVLYQQNKIDEACLIFAKESINGLNSDIIIKNAINDILKQINSSDQVKCDLYYKLGLLYYRNNDYSNAVNAFLNQKIVRDINVIKDNYYCNNIELEKSIEYNEHYNNYDIDKNTVFLDIDDSNLLNHIINYIIGKLYSVVFVVTNYTNLILDKFTNTKFILINKDKDAYRRYLSKAKYIITNVELPAYYIKKEKQYFHNNLNLPIDIFNKDKNKIKNEKTTILFHVGTFKRNGITKSFLNLTNFIDYNIFDIYVVYEPKEVDINFDINMLNKNIKIIKRYPRVSCTFEEKYIIDKIKKYNIIESSLVQNFEKRIYQKEFLRVFPNLTFDYVVNFTGYSNFWFNLFAYGPQKSTKIVYLHSDMRKEAENRYFYLYNNFNKYNNYDKLICVSKGSLHSNLDYLTKYNINKNKFKYSNNIIDHNTILKNSIVSISKDDEEYFDVDNVFISIGRLSKEKGFEKLIYSFVEVVKYYNSSKLIIIGEGPLMNELIILIEKLNMTNNIYLLGYRLNPISLLNKSDCYVLSSDYEGEGMVLYEALILNKYIISTDIDGPNSILKDKNAKLVENSVDGLSRGMIYFIENNIESSLKFDYIKYHKYCIKSFYNNVLGCQITAS